MKKIVSLGAAAFLILSGVGCETHHQHNTSAKAYPLSTCLASGEPLGKSPVARVYNGQEVKFCCADCAKEFDKNPSKLMVKLGK